MKKTKSMSFRSVFSAVLAFCMSFNVMFSAAPVVVFATSGGHDLQVTKAGGMQAVCGTEDSHEGADYYWLENGLTLLSSGLTITGETTTEYVVFDTTGEVTLKDVKISSLENSAFEALSEDCTIILAGKNELSGSSGIYFGSSGTITGDGDLTASSITDNGIYGCSVITISASGNIVADGQTAGIYGSEGIAFTKTVGKVLAYGYNEDCGGMIWNSGGINLPNGAKVTASAEYQTAEASLTSNPTCNADGIFIGGDRAKSVLVIVDPKVEPDEGHDISVKKGTEKAAAGTDYTWDDDVLLIKTDGLTVSGTTTADYIVCEDTVTDLTIKNLSITSTGANTPIMFNNTSGTVSLTLAGTNSMSSECGCVAFGGVAIIAGEGSLTVVSGANGIEALGTLAISASGTLDITSGTYLVSADDFTVTNTSARVILHGDSDDYGAIKWNSGSFAVANGLTVTASASFDAEEAAITDDADYTSNNYIVTDGSVAKSVLITVAPTSKKLSDILPSDFPTTKETAWKAENGNTVYKNTTSGTIDISNGSSFLPFKLDTILQASGDNYVYSTKFFTTTFVMEDGVLSAITMVHDKVSSFNGTYAASKGSGTQADPWTVGTKGHKSDVKAYLDGNVLHIIGSGTIGSLDVIENKDSVVSVYIDQATVTGCEADSFAGIDSAALTLPDGWQGELPDDDGNWYGGTWMSLMNIPFAVKNVMFSQNYPWNGKVTITADVTGEGECPVSAKIYQKASDIWTLVAEPTIAGDSVVDLDMNFAASVKFVWNSPEDLAVSSIYDIYVEVVLNETQTGKSEEGKVDTRTEIALKEGNTTLENIGWSDTFWGAASASNAVIGWTSVDLSTSGQIAADLIGDGITDINLPERDGVYYLTHTTASGGTITSFVKFTVSGFPVYTVTDGTAPDAKGHITLDKTSAVAEETVEITVTPDIGYQLKTLTVTYIDGTQKTINPTQDSSDKTKYTFDMPAFNAAVTAVFEEVPKTVAEILATYSGFPTSDANAWKSENGGICFYTQGALIISNVNSAAIEGTASLSKIGNDYVFVANGWAATFKMKDGSLTGINTEAFLDNFNFLKGTYEPPHVHSFTYSGLQNILTATCDNTDGKCGLTDHKVILTLKAPSSLVYDGNDKAVSFESGDITAWEGAGLQLPNVVYTKYNGESFVPYSGTPTEVGSYKATVYAGDDGANAFLQFEITKAKVEVPTVDTGLVYTGSPQSPIEESEDYTVSGDINATQTGDYEITVSLKDPINYEWDTEAPTSEPKTLAWSIAQAAGAITVDTTTITKTYGEEVILPTATSNFGKVTCDKTSTDLTAAGEYTVTYKLEGTDNYSGDEKKLTVVIEVAKVEKPKEDTTVFAYTGKAQTYTVEESELYAVIGNIQTGAGNYDVTISLKDKANYKWADSSTDDLTYSFNIAQAKNAIRSLTIGNWNESESPIAPVAAADFGEVRFVYCTAGEHNFIIESLPTTEGEYIVKAYVVATDDYEGAEAEKAFTIYKTEVVQETDPEKDPDTNSETDTEVVETITPEDDPVIDDKVSSNKVWIGVSIAVICGGGFLFLFAKKKKKDDVEE